VSSAVLDASALLALLGNKPGSAPVAAAIANGAAMSAVNLAEVVAALQDTGVPEANIRAALSPLAITVVALDTDLAYRTGLLRAATRSAGLSLGDRACLALAQHLGVPALTTDRPWAALALAIQITVIR
jgi:ribonuclease VapC